jgi:peptidoglycan/xylan/chitin deacetylase (PgdA/CDA1 family)
MSTLEVPGPVRWRPSALVLASLALHLLALPALLLQPHWWPQLLALLAANHLLLTICGLLPRAHWLGPNLTRLPAASAARSEIAITIDDGPDPQVTPAVLDLLDRHQAKATFFCIGERAARYPELCREIVRRGHDVENHSHEHRHGFSFMGPRGLRRELRRAQETLTALTGRAPVFFRAPAGLRNPLLDPVLPGLGLRLASWTRRGFDTRTADPQLLLRRLTRGLRAGDILLLHDGNGARTDAGQPVVLTVLDQLLARAAAQGLYPVTLRQAHR